MLSRGRCRAFGPARSSRELYRYPHGGCPPLTVINLHQHLSMPQLLIVDCLFVLQQRGEAYIDIGKEFDPLIPVPGLKHSIEFFDDTRLG